MTDRERIDVDAGVDVDIDVDVVVIGAGISGISAAHHLQTMCPDRRFTILEARDDLGGTWDLFRYPGVRSDSDMHTLGFSFKPWVHDESIVDGSSILAYLRETVAELGIGHHIRFGHRVRRASWSSDEARWTLSIDHRGRPVELTCRFVMVCAGYYSYRGGYAPDFPGRDRFTGPVVHPQQWPDDLDHRGKRVVVIGSGATAMTLVPAMAGDATHVTMLQRSPTWVIARPDRDTVANLLRRVLPDRWAYAITRRKNVALGQLFYRRTRSRPDRMRRLLSGWNRRALGDDVAREHFTPDYGVWDQRLCLIPNGDLYRSINSGAASVVTDTIDTFTEDGIALTSGGHLDTDIIVTATGLQLVTLGEMEVEVDGATIDFSEVFTYKGLAYEGVPNLTTTFGYLNASWTLRADMVSAYACRLLNHLRATGTDACVPRRRPSELDMPRRPWVDDFSAGYVTRMLPHLPKQGDRDPWLVHLDYWRDRKLLERADVDDGVMQFVVARHPAPV